MRVLFVTPNTSSNSLGRTMALFDSAAAAGIVPAVAAVEIGTMWSPVVGTRFASAIHPVDAFLDNERFDVVVCVKPFDETLRASKRLGRQWNVPVAVDIDDPDLVATLSPQSRLRRLAKSVLRRSVMRDAKARLAQIEGIPLIVSNPYLQLYHGGAIIPHARFDRGPGGAHVSRSPVVAFVGTNREHKGTGDLREAVAAVHAETGIRLIVTDTRPADAKPWEHWTGPTTLDEGLNLLAGADIVVLPSRSVPFAYGQLPAKLMDAMLAGRAIAVSDIEPMPWALKGAGRIIPPGDIAEIERVLREFADPTLRQQLGDMARKRALDEFEVSVVGARFAEFLRGAVDGRAEVAHAVGL